MGIISHIRNLLCNSRCKTNVRIKKKMGLFGVRGLSFSLKRAVGVSEVKRKVARTTGVPTTRGGLERKIGKMAINAVLGKKKK